MNLNDLRKCEEMDFVSANLKERTAYEGLAEECCELAQAAIKVIRATDGENPTPVSVEEAKEKIKEEAGDVMMYLELLGYIPRGTTKDNPKWMRWAKRICERGKDTNVQTGNGGGCLGNGGGGYIGNGGAGDTETKVTLLD